MWQIGRDLVASGVTIFLTTQHFEEADELADRLAVLDHGRVVAEGTADELKRRIPGGHVRLHFLNLQGIEAAMSALGQGTRGCTRFATRPRCCAATSSGCCAIRR
jgi:ABC-2 type transport system ATP-binding protein